MTEPTLKTRVVKLGGSRLPFANLKSEVARWLARQTPSQNIWIVGGGQAVEHLRRKDRSENLDSNDVHWEAIKIMNENATRLGNFFPDWSLTELVATTNNSHATPANQILLVSNWLSNCAQQLPISWDVTSDSIAAVVARHTRADELVLLKSTDPPSDGTIASAIKASFVDTYFETAVAAWTAEQPYPRIRAVNMETSDFRESDLQFHCLH